MIEAIYGFWVSPITAEIAAEGAKKIVEMTVDGEQIYWSETRPENKGRYTIVEAGKGDITPPDFNARSAVHEYGGGAFTVKDGVVVATQYPDHTVHIKKPGEDWKLLLDGKGTRFANFNITPKGIVAVGETHRDGKEPENFLALIKEGSFSKLASGHDFYASPAISPDGNKIAFITWDHPHMPWTNTELWMLENQQLTKIAGGEEAIFQPQWSPEGVLYFISDRDEWWNLYRYKDGKVEKVFSIEAELGRPLWVFNLSTYAFLDNKIVFLYFQNGFYHVGQYDLKSGKLAQLERPGIQYPEIRAGKDFVALIEDFSDRPTQVVKLPSGEIVKGGKEEKIDPGYISKAEHISFPTSRGQTAYGYFYKPVNKDYTGKKNTLPPLIVMIHGGPTSQAKPAYNLETQFWTSHGFAVLDVNYRGSTGYGRTYRMLLNDNWGIVDVEDCVYGAKYLAGKGLIDPNWEFISGGSAGGFTVLAALAFHNEFKGGANYYGVADLSLLAHDTHKFESRYLDGLLGKDPQVWKDRSPINHLEHFNAPLIIFQGTEDKVVLPNQSEAIYHALKKRGVKTELIMYKGEQHGFRKKESIVDSLEKELEFFQSLMKASQT